MFAFMEKMHCPICNSTELRPIFDNTLLKCQNCGHGWANLQLDHSYLQQLYAENYFKGEEYADYLADKAILQLNFSKRAKEIASQGSAPHNALEIGCAYGFFYEIIQKQFPRLKYQGYDISADAISYAEQNYGAHFSAENYLEATAKQTYDAVFMWDVIEHLSDPGAFLAKVQEECEPGAKIYLTTGDFGALLPRLQGKKWRMIHPPTHLHYFTKKSMNTLLKKHGFEPVFYKYPPVYRSLGLIYFALFILNKKPNRFHQWLYKKIPKAAAIPINTRDIFFVCAQKM
jgi:2-polyprenyl-3-methyl-5-hydroxy-6-metoxy-1,4-benzoquinol methylase